MPGPRGKFDADPIRLLFVPAAVGQDEHRPRERARDLRVNANTVEDFKDSSTAASSRKASVGGASRCTVRSARSVGAETRLRCPFWPDSLTTAAYRWRAAMSTCWRDTCRDMSCSRSTPTVPPARRPRSSVRSGNRPRAATRRRQAARDGGGLRTSCPDDLNPSLEHPVEAT